MIERHKSLDYYAGARAMLEHINGGESINGGGGMFPMTASLLDILEAEAMEEMAELMGGNEQPEEIMEAKSE